MLLGGCLKLLIVESNGLLREAFAKRFESVDGVEVVGQIAHLDPAALPLEIETLAPELVLIGVGVADTDVLAAVTDIMQGAGRPGVVLHGRSLTLPAALKVAEILRTVDAGFAYLDTDRIQSVEGLVSICNVVAEGRVVVDPETTKRLLGLINTHVQAMGQLTGDERTLLSMMARGETDESIAEMLGIEASMVSAKVVDVAAKFGVDGASRDARVTTTLRYLVAIGELPMDYDTGTPAPSSVRPRPTAAVQPSPPQSTPEPPFARSEADAEVTYEPHDQRRTPRLAQEPVVEQGKHEPFAMAEPLPRTEQSRPPYERFVPPAAAGEEEIESLERELGIPFDPRPTGKIVGEDGSEIANEEPHASERDDDVVVDIFPSMPRPQMNGAETLGGEPDEARREKEPPASSESGKGAIGFRYGTEGVDEFERFSNQGDQDDVQTAFRVLEWAARRGLRVRWGSRSGEGSFAVVHDVGNLSFWLLTVWAAGSIDVQFAMLLAQPPFNKVELRRDLANRLNLIQGVRIDEQGLKGRPRVPLASLKDSEDWDLFIGALDWALDEIKAFFQPAGRERKDAAN